MILSTNVIAYKGFDIIRIEGRKIRSCMRNTQRGQFYAYKDTNPLIKYVEYSVSFPTWNYTSNRLKDIKDEIDLHINNH